MDPYTAPESIPSPSSEKENTAAQQALRNPATILLILAILSLFALPLTIMGQLMKKSADNHTFLDSAIEQSEKQDTQKSDAFRRGEQFGEFVGKALSFTLWAISLPIFLVGFWRMRQGRSYGLSMTAAILACIPCFSSCCGIMLPFAIWSLAVMSRPEVKASFLPGNVTFLTLCDMDNEGDFHGTNHLTPALNCGLHGHSESTVAAGTPIHSRRQSPSISSRQSVPIRKC